MRERERERERERVYNILLQGDSGGPLIQYVEGRAVLIGTVWGDLTYMGGNYPCTYDYKSVMAFVRVSKKIDWIISETIRITAEVSA